MNENKFFTYIKNKTRCNFLISLNLIIWILECLSFAVELALGAYFDNTEEELNKKKPCEKKKIDKRK